jgi:acetoacetate decarboxylase
MKADEVVKRAFAMPLTSPVFPPGPYRFVDREYLIVTYKTDRAALEAVVPEPLTGPVRIATGTMGFKHRAIDRAEVQRALEKPNYLLKIPDVDGLPRICELVDYRLEDIAMKGAWTGPASLDLSPHALAPVAELPVREVISATHIIADLTLGLGKVIYNYLKH